MKKCAFLTMDNQSGYVIDDDRARQALANLGWEISALSWKQESVPWSEFDAVIIRSTWDYPPVVAGFLDVLDHINEVTRLANPIDMVRWNLNKTYLRDLEDRGIGIVPTVWANDLDMVSLQARRDKLATQEMVIKPVVGANGEDAFLLTGSDTAAKVQRVIDCFRNRAHMMQPFMHRVVTEGEFSLFYFNGNYSHAILKKPADSEFRSQEERGATIRKVRPESQLLLRGRQALASIVSVPLYARIDFVRDENDDFRVMEMELIEPSLYLRMHPQAPVRFAQAIDEWFSSA